MLCPRCKDQYSENLLSCPACGFDPASDSMSADDDFIEIFSTYQQSDIAFIKSVLEGEGVHYFFQGENSSILVGAGAYARLLVPADEAEKAKDILRVLGFLER